MKTFHSSFTFINVLYSIQSFESGFFAQHICKNFNCTFTKEAYGRFIIFHHMKVNIRWYFPLWIWRCSFYNICYYKENLFWLFLVKKIDFLSYVFIRYASELLPFLFWKWYKRVDTMVVLSIFLVIYVFFTQLSDIALFRFKYSIRFVFRFTFRFCIESIIKVL